MESESEAFGHFDLAVIVTGVLSLIAYAIPYILFVATLPKSKNDKLTFKERVILNSDQEVSKIFFKLEVINSIFSLASCVLFVWDTYLEFTPAWMFCLELSFSIFFMYNFFFLWYVAVKKLAFMAQPLSLVDEMTVAPVLIQCAIRGYLPSSTNAQLVGQLFKILKMLRIFRLMKIFRSMNNLISPVDDAINQQVTLLVSTLISIIVITTGFVQYIGNFNPEEWTSDGQRLEFHDALYFTVVTFSTVGYGDISPGDRNGRLMIVLVICLSLYLVPKQMNSLNALMEMQSKYAGGFTPRGDRGHVVLGCSKECQGVTQFLEEFFHEDHGTTSVQVVVVVPDEPDLYWQGLILRYSSKGRLTYLRGDLKSAFDCQRARVETARACFLLVDRNTPDPHREDSLTFMRSLAVLNYQPRLTTRLFVQLLEKENKQHLSTIGIRANNIICVKEFKMGLLAQACVAKGFSALLSNMVASSSVGATQYTQPWHGEYCAGMGKEIYLLPLGQIYPGWKFKDCVKTIYSEHKAMLFAVAAGEVAIANPGGDYLVRADDHAFVLADDQQVVEDIVEARLVAGALGAGEGAKDLGGGGGGGGGGGRGSGRARGSTEGSAAASGRRRKSLAQHLKRALSGKGGDPTAAQARHILLQAKSRMYSEVEDQEEDSATIDERLAPGSGRRRASNVAGGGSGSDGDGSRRASNVSQASFHTHTKDERKHTIMSGLQAYHDKPMNLHGQYTIITQTLEDIEHLVAALRKPHLAYRPVIIMCPLRDEEQERDEASWAAAAAAFPDVWLLQGHPRNDGDLDRALVHLAHTVVIVAGRQEGRGGEDGAATMDAETILAVVSIIARSQSRVRLVTELATGDHVEHYGVAQRQSLLNLPGVTTRQRRSLLAGAASETEVEGARRPRRVPHQLQEVYAAGGIVLSNLTETLLCQAYFNDHIVAVVSSFLQNHMDRENDGSSIAQIPMPPKFLEGRAPEACTFEALLAHMLDRHDVLTIALYRNSHHARWARSGAGEGARSRQNSFALLGDQLMDTFMRQGSNLSKVFNKKKSHRSSEHERMEQQQKEMDEDEDIVASYVVTCPEPDTLVTANDYIFVFVKDLETYNRITADEKRRTSLRVADGEVVNVNVHTPSNVYKAAQKKSKAAGGLPPRPSPPAAAAAAAAAAGPAAGPGAAEAPCPGPSARSETGSKGAPGSARASSVSRPSARVAPILGPGLGAERRPEPSPGPGEGAEMRKSKGDQRHSLDFERMPSAKFNEVLDEVSRSISGSPSASRSSAGGGPCGPNGTLSRQQQKGKPVVGISNSKNTSKSDPLVLSGRSSLVVESA